MTPETGGSSPPAALEAACSVAEAHLRLADDPRFALTHDPDQPDRRLWAHGPKTINDILAIARSHGEREYLIFEGDRCTYTGFTKAVDVLAQKLIAAGVRKGDRVAIVMRNRVEWPVCFFAAISAAAIVVPVSSWGGDLDIANCMADSGARFVFSDRDCRGFIPGSVEAMFTLGVSDNQNDLDAILGKPGGWGALPPLDMPFAVPHPDETAAIFYTSGTTGGAKGAPLSHRALTAIIKNSEYNAARLDLRFPGATHKTQDQVRALLPVPLFHVTGAIPGLIAATTIGAKIVLMRKWDVETALGLIEQEKVTLVGGVPTLPLQMLAHPRIRDFDLSSLSDVLYGGAPSPQSLAGAIEKGLQACAGTGWGMTETASTVLHNNGPEFLLRPGSCGVAVPVNQVRVVADTGAILPCGQAGELQVRGLNVFAGYWRKPDETAAAFTTDGWFRTGDIAAIADDGYVTIIDRAKDVVIRGGENIACIEIENALCEHPAVVEAAVVGRAHGSLGEEPVAFITAASNAENVEASILVFLRAHLPNHKVPASVFVLPHPLPRNAAGKVIKAALRALLTPPV